LRPTNPATSPVSRCRSMRASASNNCVSNRFTAGVLARRGGPADPARRRRPWGRASRSAVTCRATGYTCFETNLPPVQLSIQIERKTKASAARSKKRPNVCNEESIWRRVYRSGLRRIVTTGRPIGLHDSLAIFSPVRRRHGSSGQVIRRRRCYTHRHRHWGVQCLLPESLFQPLSRHLHLRSTAGLPNRSDGPQRRCSLFVVSMRRSGGGPVMRA
jgi:hypothetical protein